MHKIEYSQIVRRKLIDLRDELTLRYGEQFSQKTVAKILNSVRKLEQFSEMGKRIAELYDAETDYYYIFIGHNYFIYRIEDDKVIIVNMFNEKEDYIMKLFGISGRTQESADFWGE